MMVPAGAAPWAWPFPWPEELLAAGAAMDGPRGCREEQGAVPGLCHGPVAGSRGAGGTGGLGLPRLGVEPLCILHLRLCLWASVIPCGKGDVLSWGRGQGAARCAQSRGDTAPVPDRDLFAKLAQSGQTGRGTGAAAAAHGTPRARSCRGHGLS